MVIDDGHTDAWRPESFLNRFTAVVCLCYCAPLLALIAAAIRLESKGPAFQRISSIIRGQGARNLKDGVWRFRTCFAMDAEYSDKRVNAMGDVTPLGRLLRRTRLDRLPQLFNVLNGELSIFHVLS